MSDPQTQRTVLFVEDDDMVRGMGSRLLAVLGYTVVTAADGQEALERYAAEGAAIDVVLLDLIMPVLDGAETLQALRDAGCDSPILVASGGTPSAAVIEAADGILSKPYSLSSLSSALTQALEGRKCP